MGNLAKPFRLVLIGQIVATLTLAGACFLVSGVNGILSALLGGAVGMAGNLTFALFTRSRHAKVQTEALAWDKLGQIIKAEGAKLMVMFVFLWIVLASYKDVVMLGFIGTFIFSVIIFSMAIFIRNPASLEAGTNNVN